jgi:hypothetical protein
MKPQHIFVQRRGPHGKFPGSGIHGWFVVEGGVVRLTDADGVPERDYEWHLSSGENPEVIASVLLRRRDDARDPISDFRRPLNYPPTGKR